jgi:hypothetical protein
MRAVTSAPIADSLLRVEVVAPVMLVDSLVAPIVLEVEALGDVVVAVELLGVVMSVDAVRDVSVSVVLVESGVDVAVLDFGAEDTPYVELVPGEDVELGAVELMPYVGLVETGSVFDVGFVDAVVFRLPLVFSFVVLWLEREVS